jgi:hypothetical protein
MQPFLFDLDLLVHFSSPPRVSGKISLDSDCGEPLLILSRLALLALMFVGSSKQACESYARSLRARWAQFPEFTFC